jgi:hypothetical protein
MSYCNMFSTTIVFELTMFAIFNSCQALARGGFDGATLQLDRRKAETFAFNKPQTVGHDRPERLRPALGVHSTAGILRCAATG